MAAMSSNKEVTVNLKIKSAIELKELHDRQQKLLSNKSFLNKLPDKGRKIISFNLQIEEEMGKRDSVHETGQLFAGLNLNGVPEEIEWTGKYKAAKHENQPDSDDDSDENVDPLRLVATHSGTQAGIKSKNHKEDPSLITSVDVEHVKSFGYTEVLCKKYGNVTARERFKLNHPKSKEEVKTGFRSSSENVRTKLGKHWEVTAATPPVPIHGDTKMISLMDSLAIQTEQAQRLKKIQIEDAMARLKQSSSVKLENGLPTRNLMKYRLPVDPTQMFDGTPHRESHDDEEQNVLEEQRGGAVFYNLIDDVPDRDS